MTAEEYRIHAAWADDQAEGALWSNAHLFADSHPKPCYACDQYHRLKDLAAALRSAAEMREALEKAAQQLQDAGNDLNTDTRLSEKYQPALAAILLHHAATARRILGGTDDRR